MISPADSAQDAARGDDMTETMQKKLILIDGHSIINRAFYGMPDLTNSKGVHTGAVYGFLNILFRILDEEKADYLIVAFDEHAPTFRHEMYAAYKGTRKPMPEELRTQVPLLRRVLTAMGVEQISRAGIEADDILGTCAKKAEREGMTVSLVSGDRDLLQVATDKICVRIPKTVRGQTTIENYHPADVSERYQITPRQVIALWFCRRRLCPSGRNHEKISARKSGKLSGSGLSIARSGHNPDGTRSSDRLGKGGDRQFLHEGGLCDLHGVEFQGFSPAL